MYDAELCYMYHTDNIHILKSHHKGSIRLQQKHISQISCRGGLKMQDRRVDINVARGTCCM